MQTILNFWKENIVSGYSKANYNVAQEIIYNTKDLKSDLCDYHDDWILVRGDIIVRAASSPQVALKNGAPFAKCITKIGGTTIDDA